MEKAERSELKEFGMLCGVAAIYCVIILGASALIVIGIAKVSMGAVYLHECSIQHLIPIYLIVSGVSPVVFGQLGCGDKDVDKLCGICCALLGSIFTLIWLICGTVWVYPTYGELLRSDFTTCTGNMTTDCTEGGCNKSLIEFSVAIVTLDWIVVLTVAVCLGIYIYKDSKS